MAKARVVSVLMAFFFIAAGYTSAMGQEDSSKTSTSQATSAEHAGHNHASHDTASGDSQPAPAGHDMSQMGEMNKQNEAMMTQMNTMRAQMEKIKATKDPVERKKLMREHMTAMGSGMKMMREMDDKMMTMMMKSGKCPMMEMMSSPQGQAGTHGMMGDMAMCHQMMRQKADMNHGMMEQIIESQEQLLDMQK